MAKQEIEKTPYQINPTIKKSGYVANFAKTGGPLIVISKEVMDIDIDPKTGQANVPVVKFPSKVFINGEERKTFDLPGDLDMKVVYSLGQAKIIVLSEEQGAEYNAFAKKLHSGQIK